MSDGQVEGTGGQPGRTGFQIDFQAHLRLLRKRLWMIAFTLIVVVGAAWTWVKLQQPVYRAAGTLHIETITPQVLGDVKEVVDLGASDYWSNKEFYETQYKILASRDVLERVVEKEGLDRDLNFLGLAGISDEAERTARLERADPVAALRARLHVTPLKSSQLVEIAIEDTDPERAAELSNAVMDAYIARNLDRRLEGTHAASDWLTEQMADLKGKLESSELALYTFKKDQDILSSTMEDRQNMVSQRLVAVSDSLTKIMIRKAELDAGLTEADQARKARPEDPLWALGLARVAGTTLVTELQRDYVRQENEVAALAQRYLDKHPQRMAAEERLSALGARIASESERVVGTMRSEQREVQSTERRLVELIEGTKREAFEINKKEIDLKKLDREQGNNQRIYAMVLTRLKEADLTALLKANNARKLDKAMVPLFPVKPRPMLVLFLSIVGGVLLGLGFAYGIELLDNTIKNEADVEQALGVPFLGMVPQVMPAGAARGNRENDRNRDLYVLKNPKSAAAECCRAIRTNLLFMSPERELRRIVVTSSGPQEGKTTTCINIGITMAQAGSRVLLVDTDMRRPRLHRAFGIANEVGLSTLIVGEAQIESAAKTTDVPNLYVLPCGPIPPNPAELLHTQRFRELLEELSKRYDRVIFDTPPLVAVADAAVLATLSDGVLLVTRFRKTTRLLARRALRSLHDVNATILGVVMNDVNLQSREYDYYYYRKYGSYYTENESAKA